MEKCITCHHYKKLLIEEPCCRCDDTHNRYEAKRMTNEEHINAMPLEEKAKFFVSFPDFDRYMQDRWCMKLCPHRLADGTCEYTVDGEIDCPYSPLETAMLWLKAEAEED